ncbi:cupin domain-containing protein [Nitrospira sp. BLG_2]|uniref:cupin domain-containing protein n=1 Tax=Nitrospira sp. BLG_2 TaxID=3397507 RepID=UPI003B9CCC53
MSELKLPEELEGQAILHALGILDPDDRRAFMVRLRGESDLLRQAATAYQATTDALAASVTPVTPSATLRERLVKTVALEAGRETEQFDLAANTLALASLPVKPRDSVRERLFSRIEGHSDIRPDVTDSARVLSETPALLGEEGRNKSEGRLSQDVGSLATWPRSCWTAVLNFLRTILIRSVTSERVRYWKAKIALQQPTKGLTFIRASEGNWRGIAPGVTAKLLSFDPASRRATTLLCFAPGTSYAPHRHTAAEELYVLEGGCSIAGREMAIGDYHRAEAGTVHHDTSTDDGCLLLVISSPQNEMLR